MTRHISCYLFAHFHLSAVVRDEKTLGLRRAIYYQKTSGSRARNRTELKPFWIPFFLFDLHLEKKKERNQLLYFSFTFPRRREKKNNMAAGYKAISSSCQPTRPIYAAPKTICSQGPISFHIQRPNPLWLVGLVSLFISLSLRRRFHQVRLSFGFRLKGAQDKEAGARLARTAATLPVGEPTGQAWEEGDGGGRAFPLASGHSVDLQT